MFFFHACMQNLVYVDGEPAFFCTICDVMGLTCVRPVAVYDIMDVGEDGVDVS